MAVSILFSVGNRTQDKICVVCSFVRSFVWFVVRLVRRSSGSSPGTSKIFLGAIAPKKILILFSGSAETWPKTSEKRPKASENVRKASEKRPKASESVRKRPKTSENVRKRPKTSEKRPKTSENVRKRLKTSENAFRLWPSK